MKKPFPLRHRLMWLAPATLGALLLFASTRSLLVAQVRSEALAYGLEQDPAAERALAARIPNDYPVQLALAAEDTTLSSANGSASTDPMAAPKARNRRIGALIQRFPNNPSVYANLLRYMTLEEVRLYQPAPDSAPTGTPGTTPAPPSLETLALFEEAAIKGAQLDPDNAYFPLMQAVGLFTVHRDQDALEALRVAGRCSQWREYFMDELEGANRLQSATFARWGVVQRFRNLYSLRFPQYAQFRAVARTAVQRAAVEEHNGQVADGIAIRHALMHSGGLLRAQGATGITALVGVAMANIATNGPGSDKEMHFGRNKNPETPQEREQRRNRYYAYLETMGMPQKAAWARTEMQAGDQAKEIVLKGVKNPDYSGLTFVQFCAAWLVNLCLLFSAAVMLLLGGMAYYSLLLRKGFPAKSRPFLRGAYALSAIVCLGLWQWTAVSDGLISVTDLISTLDDTVTQNQLAALQLGVFIVSLLIPALFVSLIAGMSRKQRVPVLTGLGRGVRGTAFPIAAVLFLLYGLSLLPTAYFEAKIDKDYARTIQNEPRYFAEIVGKAWPGDPTP